MFNKFNFAEQCDFKSNSVVRRVPVVVPLEKNGKITNHVEFKTESLESPLAGAHFDENIHGLRAKLNLGIKLSEVPNVNVDDFAIAYNKLNTFGSSIDAYVVTRNAEAKTLEERATEALEK